MLRSLSVLDDGSQPVLSGRLPLGVVQLNGDHDLPKRHDFAQENVRPGRHFESIQMRLPSPLADCQTGLCSSSFDPPFFVRSMLCAYARGQRFRAPRCVQIASLMAVPHWEPEFSISRMCKKLPASNLEGVAYRFETPGAQHRLFLPDSMLLERSDDGCSCGLNLGCGTGSWLTSLLLHFFR